MKRHFARRAVGTVLALMALSSSVSSVAADPPAPGTLLIVAGMGPKGFSGDGGPATQARLNAPFGLAFDATGNLFITEMENRRLRKVTPEGIITTAVGGGNTPLLPDASLPATEARLGDAHSVAFDGDGNQYLSAFYSGRIWKVSPEGRITGISRMRATGLAADTAGNLFIADFLAGRVQRRSPDGTMITVAGGGTQAPNTANGGPATAAKLGSAWGVAIDAVGNLFIVDPDGHRVWKVSPDGIIHIAAGTGQFGFSGDGGPATAAQLDFPTGLAVDGAGNLFIADYGNYRVRKVSPDGIISTVAGTGAIKLSGVGGLAASAGLRGPIALAVDESGNLFIADTGWIDEHLAWNKVPANEHVLVVVGAAAPGLIAGKPFPKP